MKIVLSAIIGLILGYTIQSIKAYLVKIHDRYIERQWKRKEEQKRNQEMDFYFQKLKIQNEIWIKEKERAKSN